MSDTKNYRECHAIAIVELKPIAVAVKAVYQKKSPLALAVNEEERDDLVTGSIPEREEVEEETDERVPISAQREGQEMVQSE